MNTTVAISICSNALVLLGHDVISSFSDDGIGAKVANSFYETTLLAILGGYKWNFATKQVKLNLLTEKPLNRWQYMFQLPTDNIRVITVHRVSDYEIVGDKIYSDSKELDIDYMHRPDESFFPPLFREAFEFHLASKWAIPVTENATNADLYYGIAEKAFRKVKNIDSKEDTMRGVSAAAALPYAMRNGGSSGGRRWR